MPAGSILWGSWGKKVWNALILGSPQRDDMSMSVQEFNETYGSLVACGGDWMDLCVTFVTQLEKLGVHAPSLDIVDAHGVSFTRIDPTGEEEGLFVSLNNTWVDGSGSSVEWVLREKEPTLTKEHQEETDSLVYCLSVPVKKKDCVIGVVTMHHNKLSALRSEDFLRKLDMLVAMLGYLLPDDMLRPLCGSLGKIQRGSSVQDVVMAAMELLWSVFPVIGLKLALIGCNEQVAALFGLQENEQGTLQFSSSQEAFVLATDTAAFGMLGDWSSAYFDCTQDDANLKDIQGMKRTCPMARTVLVVLLRFSEYSSLQEESECESEPVLTLGLGPSTGRSSGWGSLFGVVYLGGPREGTFNFCRGEIESCCKVLSWKLQDRMQSDLREEKAIAFQEGRRIARETTAPNGGSVSYAEVGEVVRRLTEGLDRHKMIMRTKGHDYSLLQIRECIGEGTLALVYDGHWQGANAAIKIFVGNADHNATLKLATEVVLITAVTHPNIIRTYNWLANLTYGKILALAGPGGGQDIDTADSMAPGLPRLSPAQVELSERLTKKWYNLPLKDTRWNILIMEHCDRHTLDKELRKEGSAFILPANARRIANMPVLISIACQIAYAMRHLHTQNIIHGDLKPDNILLQSDTSSIGFRVKVTDFGTSRILHTGYSLRHELGTLVYMPPEVLTSNSSIVSSKLDVYSYGIILWEMYSRRRPYANIGHSSEIKRQVCHDQLRPQFDEHCQIGFQSLAQRCWAENMDERPSFIAIAEELECMRSALSVHESSAHSQHQD